MTPEQLMENSGHRREDGRQILSGRDRFYEGGTEAATATGESAGSGKLSPEEDQAAAAAEAATAETAKGSETADPAEENPAGDGYRAR